MLIRLLFATALAILALSKKVCLGPRGCRGRKGPDGLAGPPGPNGQDGLQGKDGPLGQGSVIYCYSSSNTTYGYFTDDIVSFGSCVQTNGYIPLDDPVQGVEVTQNGVYQIYFYADGTSKYTLRVNGLPAIDSVIGAFDALGADLYTQGQFVTSLVSGDQISVVVERSVNIPGNQFGAVTTQLMVQLVARAP